MAKDDKFIFTELNAIYVSLYKKQIARTMLPKNKIALLINNPGKTPEWLC
ncbi:hypothetical protein LM957_002335 [Staphylococcus pseudintermedius]|nr:hypothetical protein [Staphylococcus pseudintermedius]